MSVTVKEALDNHHPLSGPCEHALCPLNRAQVGSSLRIRQLAASPDMCHRLRELGFCEEQQIRLVSLKSNVICQVCNARLGISSQLAEMIMVEPVNSRYQAA